jgi:hypothetical protein
MANLLIAYDTNGFILQPNFTLESCHDHDGHVFLLGFDNKY